MNSSELVTSPVLPAVSDEHESRSARSAGLAPVLAVAALSIVGAVLRVIVARQSVFADELSTYWISATHGLGDVVSLLYSAGLIHHAEITPPLSFLASWLTTRLGHSPELLRLPALIAGVASIPAVYLLGLRMVRRRTALVATALTAFSPFMIYYSAEARAYGLMMFLVICSTLSLLSAIDTRRRLWWGLYAVSSAAAFYTHYTCAFVLAAQLLWVLWAHPEARRPALLANVGAALLVTPWIPGLINDLTSPTLKILSNLSPFTAHDVRIDLQHWAIGYPYTIAGPLAALPGVPALVLLGCAAVLTGGALAARALSVLGGSPRPASRSNLLGRLDRRVLLALILAAATPVAEIVVSFGGNHIIGVRDLAASWPFLALGLALALSSPGPRLGLVGAALAVLAFALGASKMLQTRFQRPDYQAAANYVAEHARSRDVVIDVTGGLSPGPLTGLDVTLHRRLRVLRAQAPRERDHPFGVFDPLIPLQSAVKTAVAAAHGARIFLVTPAAPGPASSLTQLKAASADFRAGYRLAAVRTYPGILPTIVAVYAIPAHV
jgi:Dolichyl-phosphate-mannose-protein mannosyltransferase